jgi:hypothetical protein
MDLKCDQTRRKGDISLCSEYTPPGTEARLPESYGVPTYGEQRKLKIASLVGRGRLITPASAFVTLTPRRE